MNTLAIDLTTSDIKLGLDINGVFSDYKNTDQPNFDKIFFLCGINLYKSVNFTFIEIKIFKFLYLNTFNYFNCIYLLKISPQ